MILVLLCGYIGDDVAMSSNRSKIYDGPEFIVSREFFNRYFEKPLPKSAFHDLVNRGRILQWPAMRGDACSTSIFTGWGFMLRLLCVWISARRRPIL